MDAINLSAIHAIPNYNIYVYNIAHHLGIEQRIWLLVDGTSYKKLVFSHRQGCRPAVCNPIHAIPTMATIIITIIITTTTIVITIVIILAVKTARIDQLLWRI